MRRAAIICVLALCGYCMADYTMPIGIPDPGWGIDDTVTSYYGPGTGATYDYSDDAPTGAIAYRLNDQGEPYTHFIDPDHESATDENNPHGTKDEPRETWPADITSLAAGSVVEVHSLKDSLDGYTGKMEGDGTLAAPIFIRGTITDIPVLTTDEDYTMWPDGSYMIIENIEFDGDEGAWPQKPGFIWQDQRGGGAKTHLAVRGCEFHNTASVPHTGGMLIKVVATPDYEAENLVFYNNHFHHCGEGRTKSQDDGGKDIKGIGSFGGCKHVWILNNTCHDMSASLQQTMFQDASSSHPEYIYIGDNVSHDNFEAGYSCKDGKHIIYSQNIAYNFGEEYSGNPDDEPVFSNSGCGGEFGAASVGKENIWYLFNIAYNSTTEKGVFPSYSVSDDVEDFCTDIYYIGNILYNCTNTAGTSKGFNEWNRVDSYYIANVTYNVDQPFSITLDRHNWNTDTKVIVNNILGDNPENSSWDDQKLRLAGDADSFDRMVMSHNLFYEAGEAGSDMIRRSLYDNGVLQGLHTPYTIPEWETAFSTKAVGFIEDDPCHTDAANADFTLLAASAAIDAGTNSGAAAAAYDTFYSLYGIDIEKDFAEIARPQNALWDIGPYEYVEGDSTKPTPDPMTWATEPAASGETSVIMTASTASDASGVEYYFDETSGNTGGADSGWQDGTEYEDTGLAAATTYTYTVKARDKSANQNETSVSTPAVNATTDPDTHAPTPDPMTFAVAPASSGETSIDMTASTATDPNYSVEYYFDETSGNSGGSDSGWQASTTYEDTGLVPAVQYTYTVKARDTSPNNNETVASSAANATTDADTVSPTPSTMTWESAPAASGSSAITMIASVASDASGVEYQFVETSGNPGATSSGWQDSRSYVDSGLTASTQYTYTVQARDKSVGNNTNTASAGANATTDAGSPGTLTSGDAEWMLGSPITIRDNDTGRYEWQMGLSSVVTRLPQVVYFLIGI